MDLTEQFQAVVENAKRQIKEKAKKEMKEQVSDIISDLNLFHDDGRLDGCAYLAMYDAIIKLVPDEHVE